LTAFGDEFYTFTAFGDEFYTLTAFGDDFFFFLFFLSSVIQSPSFPSVRCSPVRLSSAVGELLSPLVSSKTSPLPFSSVYLFNDSVVSVFPSDMFVIFSAYLSHPQRVPVPCQQPTTPILQTRVVSRSYRCLSRNILTSLFVTRFFCHNSSWLLRIVLLHCECSIPLRPSVPFNLFRTTECTRLSWLHSANIRHVIPPTAPCHLAASADCVRHLYITCVAAPYPLLSLMVIFAALDMFARIALAHTPTPIAGRCMIPVALLTNIANSLPFTVTFMLCGRPSDISLPD
jgi:hypothetical protein